MGKVEKSKGPRVEASKSGWFFYFYTFTLLTLGLLDTVTLFDFATLRLLDSDTVSEAQRYLPFWSNALTSS